MRNRVSLLLQRQVRQNVQFVPVVLTVQVGTQTDHAQLAVAATHPTVNDMRRVN